MIEVTYVDHLGDDLRTVNAARVSFNKTSDEFTDRDAKLVSYLGREKHFTCPAHNQLTLRVKLPIWLARQFTKHCYSEDTEVFTQQGWKMWRDVTTEDKLAAVREDGGFIFEHPTEVYRRHYEGDLIHFKSTSMDLLVTDKHRMYVSKRRRTSNNKTWWTDFHIQEADQCTSGEWKLPKLPTYVQDEGSDHDFYYGCLLGMHIGDGYKDKNRLVFSFKKQRKVEYLINILDKLDILDYRRSINCNNYTNIRMDNPDRELFTQEKQLPKNLSTYSRKFLEGLYDGLLNSDGTTTTSGTERFVTTLEYVCKDFEYLCTLLGRSNTTHKTERMQKHWADSYNITIKQNKYRHIRSVSKVPYKGNVYCASVSTGLLLVRRNGKTNVCGNCVGAVVNEVSRRYVDTKPEVWWPDQWKSRPDKSIKQGSGTPVSDLVQHQANEAYAHAINDALATYDKLLMLGVAPEEARSVLPQGTYTELFVTGSLVYWARMYKLRNGDHGHPQSQWVEITDRLDEICRPLWPHTWESLI